MAAPRYTATLTTAALRWRESRIIATWLLDQLDPQQWKQALLIENQLQIKSPAAAQRIAGCLRSRLEPLGPRIWAMIRDGGRVQSSQAVLAGIIAQSRLLGDFMDLAIREQRSLFATHLEPRVWTDYLEACRGRDPAMPDWSETTVTRLRSTIFSILSTTGYIQDIHSLKLQTVLIDESLAACLAEQGQTYVLRCLRVLE